MQKSITEFQENEIAENNYKKQSKDMYLVFNV